MKRIVIVGIPGSGKSTFANKLGKKLNREVIHLDKEYWAVNWEKKYPEKQDWKNFVKELVKQDEWIIDGNYQSTMNIRFDRADTIIYFDLPRWRSLWRAFIRVFHKEQPRGRAEGTIEKISWVLIKFILTYPKKEIRQMIQNHADAREIFVVRNNREINKLFLKLTS